MNQQTEENYSFCPKCGSLMENGVCPECAKQKDQGIYSSQNFPQGLTEQQPDTTGAYSPAGYSQAHGQSQPGAYQNQAGQYGQGAYQSQAGQYGQGAYQSQPDPYGQGAYQSQPGQYGQNPYQNQQGPYQQNPYQNPSGYYVQPGNQGAGFNPYMKPKKDNQVWMIVGIVAAIVVLLLTIIGSFLYGYFITKIVTTDADSYTGRYDFDNGDRNYGGSDYADEEEPDSYEEAGDDYVPSLDDEYYYGPCDAINEDVDYSFITKSYNNEDPDNDIDVIINYFELEGDSIPNIDELNEALEKVALYYAVDFPQYASYAEYGESYAVYITSYVTYNDADMISIVLDEYIMVDDRYHVDLYPINIDIKNGVILDNDSLLQIDGDFAEEFRRRNDEQNGSIDYLDALSDEELTLSLQDGDNMIAFYTPLGMEIGLNYEDVGSSGWFTVTYKDYDRYLSKF